MDKYKKIKEPDDLEEIIQNAYKRAKEEKKSKIKSTFTKIGTTVATAVIVFAISVNTSTAFANYIDDIPVLDKLAQFFKFDRGLEEAGKKGFLQVIDKKYKDEGITFKIENVVYDNKRIVIKYSYTSKENLENLWVASGKVTYGDGSDVDGALISLTPIDDNHDENIKSGIMDIEMLGEINKDKHSIIIYPKFSRIGDGTKFEGEQINGNWNIDIPIKHELLSVKTKKYNIDDEFQIEGIKINIWDLKIHPTVGELKVKFDDENSDYKFGGFTQTYLIDGKEEKYELFSSNFSIKGERTVRFESNYFIDSRDMKLKVGGIYVIPKKTYDFYIDVKNETSSSNCDYDIKLRGMQKNEKGDFHSFIIDIQDERLLDKNINIIPLMEIGALVLEDGTKFQKQEDYMVSYSIGNEETERVFINFHKPISQNFKFTIDKIYEYRPVNKRFDIN